MINLHLTFEIKIWKHWGIHTLYQMTRVSDPDNEGKWFEISWIKVFFIKKFWWTKKKQKKTLRNMSSMFRMLMGAIQKKIVFRCFMF